MKRRIISSLLCLSIAASLVGCSTDAVMYDKYSKQTSGGYWYDQ